MLAADRCDVTESWPVACPDTANVFCPRVVSGGFHKIILKHVKQKHGQ